MVERRNFLKGLAGVSAGIVASVLGGKKAVGENIPGEILELKAEPIQPDRIVKKVWSDNDCMNYSDMLTVPLLDNPVSDCTATDIICQGDPDSVVAEYLEGENGLTIKIKRIYGDGRIEFLPSNVGD